MTLPENNICWQAVCENDNSYDGVFYYAVRTTGIYCRPSCKSRLPKSENVEYFTLPAQAQQAGYRACKRCQPLSITPQNETAQRIQSICDVLESERPIPTLSKLSERFYLSPTYLQRQFKQYLGISPRQFAEACQMQQFKTALNQGASVTQAMTEAGYTSSSRLYEKTDGTLGMTPRHYQQKGQTMTIVYRTLECDLGVLLVAKTERGICSVTIGDDDAEVIALLVHEFSQADIQPDDGELNEAMKQLTAYLNGWQPHFDLPLDLRVTAFQKLVLDELQRIPYSETRSYGEIAKAIGKPKAARAVGNACNKNPIPIIVPCHRVVHSDGRDTGYAYGIERKRILLDVEKQDQ